MPDHTKLAVILRDFEGGGAEMAMINIANGMARQSVNVDLVVFSQKGPFRDNLDPRVRLVSLGTPTIGLSTFRAVLPLRRYLESSSVTHMITTLEATTIVTYFARKLMVEPPSWTVRVATTFEKEKRPRIREFMIRHIYRKHRGMFVANSKGSAENLSNKLAIPASSISVIYNGVDLNRIRNLSAQSVTSADLDQDDRFVLNIGRLTYAKRQDVLINSFSRLKDQELKLVILGEGPLKSELKALAERLGIKDRVVFAGFVKNPYAFVARANVLVLSSCYEGMPTVLVEALSCGCPVVSTDCPSGPREILADGKWGFLVPVNNVEALAQAIEKCLSDSPNRAFLKKRASEFSVDAMTNEYCTLIFGARD